MIGSVLVVLPFLSAQAGIASWYDWPRDPLSGHSLMCHRYLKAEAFQKAKAQGCAHRTLPCGTQLLVTNVKNGLSHTCTVVDRGPYGAMHKGRWVIKRRATDQGEWRGIIDLSLSVASAIRLPGMGPVLVQVLSLPASEDRRR